MSTKHTPGPWQWDGNPCDYHADKEAPWLVTDAYAAGHAASLRDGVILKGQIACLSEANARLIAAAPELLEALIALHAVARVSRDVDYWKVTNAAVVIAKATGSTE